MSSCPEILRRDPKAFADRTVSLADILREREYGSDSSSVELMRELQHESLHSSRSWLMESPVHSSASTISAPDDDDEGLPDWLGAALTPVSIRFNTEFTESEEEDTGASHNVRRVTRSQILLTRCAYAFGVIWCAYCILVSYC